jgi:hypothetical protein
MGSPRFKAAGLQPFLQHASHNRVKQAQEAVMRAGAAIQRLAGTFTPGSA